MPARVGGEDQPVGDAQLVVDPADLRVLVLRLQLVRPSGKARSASQAANEASWVA